MAAFSYPNHYLQLESTAFASTEAKVAPLDDPFYYSPDGTIIPLPVKSSNDGEEDVEPSDHYRISSSLGSEKLHAHSSLKKKAKERQNEWGVGRRKTQSKRSSIAKEAKEKAKKSNNNEKVRKGPSNGCIHVRARRGQATDSHSLAERVRREKIRDRMKLLQELVPGCDKVTGKALMLDEIINYVQSLQSQVEFLSMKLASVSPIMWDFTMGDYVLEQKGADEGSPPIPSVNHIHPTAFVLDYSSPFMLHGQGPLSYYVQDNGSSGLQDVGHSERFLQLQFSNINSS